MDPRAKRTLRRRIQVFQWAAAGTVGLLAAVYAWLQIVKAPEMREKARNQAIQQRSIPAPRGIIYDRNANRLVDNRKALHLVVAEEELPSDPAVLDRVAQALGLDADQLKRKVAAWRVNGKGRSLVLMENLDEAGIALAERVRSRFPFLGVDQAPRRVYLGQELAGHILGYVGEVDEKLLKKAPETFQLGEIIGKDGFEASSNGRLRGEDGVKKVLVDQLGREVAVSGQQPAKPGRSLFLTVDAGLQQVMAQSFGQEKGAGVVIDLRDGGILALYSSPSYDPNLFLNRLSQEMVDRYIRNEERPLLNRATQGIYAPGSTWKLLMALAGLEKGVITPNTVFFCGGRKAYYGHEFRCDHTHGGLALVQAIAQSCDIYFYEVASRLDIDDIYSVAQKSGLTDITGIDLPFEKEPRVPSRAWKAKAKPKEPKWYAGETISVGIGQGAVGLTPIALARFYGLLATKGKLLTPHLFRGFRNEDTGEIQLAPSPEIKEAAFDPRWWPLLHEGMAKVVDSGTATGNAVVRAVSQMAPFSGKTGTSQVTTFTTRAQYLKLARHLKDNSLFAGFAPREAPQIAFAVVVENAGWGSEAAAPIAAKLVQYWCVDRIQRPLPPPGGRLPDAYAQEETAQ